MTAEQFFHEHGVSRIEELSHEELLEFAQVCMDFFSAYSARTLLSGAFGVCPDPMPEETDAGIIEAYNKGLSFIASYIMHESCDGIYQDDKPGTSYKLSVQDRRDILKNLELNNK